MPPPAARQDPEEQLQERLAFVSSRLPLLERGAELASASLVELQQRLAHLKEGMEARPRRTVGPRLERLKEEVAFIRRQLERLAERIEARRTSPREQKRGGA